MAVGPEQKAQNYAQMVMRLAEDSAEAEAPVAEGRIEVAAFAAGGSAQHSY